MIGTPLMIGEAQRAMLKALRETASNAPVNVQGLLERLKDADAKRAHMDHMNKQTIQIPFGYLVTYSIETGHPWGTVRHMSISSLAKGRIPTTHAAWMVCEELGFVGSLEMCMVWIEDLKRGDQQTGAINVVQKIS